VRKNPAADGALEFRFHDRGRPAPSCVRAPLEERSQVSPDGGVQQLPGEVEADEQNDNLGKSLSCFVFAIKALFGFQTVDGAHLPLHISIPCTAFAL